MNTYRAFSTILSRAIKSKTFVASVAMIVMFRFLNFLPEMLRLGRELDESISISGNVLYYYEIIGMSFITIIIMVVPVLPYCSGFCDDYKSNYMTYLIMNMGKSTYCGATVIACAVSSFLCVFIADIILSVSMGMLIPIFNVRSYGMLQGIFLLLSRIVLLSLQGAFFSTIAMMLSIFTVNKFIIYTSPIILHFFFMMFGENVLHISTKINPSMIYNYYIFGDGKEVQSIIYAIVYLVFFMFLTVRIMHKKIERCY